MIEAKVMTATKDNFRLRIEYLPIAELQRDQRNPRRHEKRQIRQLGLSINTHKFSVPILIDRHNKVIAGHARLLAAELLGINEVPTIRLEHLNDAQARAFAIADNRLAEIASWDDQLLTDALKELSALELDFNIEATGFTIGEIDLLIEGQSDQSETPDAKADTLPSDETKFQICKPSDLWLLGNHRVYCGDSLFAASYLALMAGKRAAMAFTDPPYNVRVDGHISGLGRVHHREFAIASGELNKAEFSEFLTKVCALLASNSDNGSIHFISIDWRHVGDVIAAGNKSYSELKNICVWVKHNAGMGSLYRSQHEFICVFKNGTGHHRNNIQLGQFGRHRSNVWSYPGAANFGRAPDEGLLPEDHPTPKPVRLVADAILDCSARGDIILDGFLGSGTTVVAAERTGRRCYGIEIDPRYVDTIIRRWQSYTGEHAIHSLTGRAFDSIEAEARLEQ
jgi:DNA modification methylase